MLASLVIPIQLFLINDRETDAEHDSDDLSTEGSLIAGQYSEKVSFWELLENPKIFACSLCMSTSMAALTYKEPILEIRLK